MATIIDALLVTLGLDATGFKKGQAETDEALKKTKENAVKHGKEIEAKAKAATEGFRQMKNQVLGLVGAFVTVSGIKSFVERITASDAAAGRLAQTLTMSTEALTAWGGIAEKLGGSAGDIESAFRLINDTFQRMRRGEADPGQVQALGMLLGDSGLEQFVSTATTIEEKMKMLQRAVAGFADQPQAMSLMQKAGFSEATVNVLREMGGNAEQLLRTQIELNSVTNQQAESAKRLAAAWKDVGAAIESAGRELLNSNLFDLTGLLIKATEKIKEYQRSPAQIAEDLWNLPENSDVQGNVGKVLKWLDDKFSGSIRGWMARNPKQFPGKTSGPVGNNSGTQGPAVGGSGLKFGSAAFNDQFYEDLRSGATFGGDAMQRLTGSAGAADLARRAAAGSRGSAPASKTEININGGINLPGVTNAPQFARELPGAIRSQYGIPTQATFGAN